MKPRDRLDPLGAALLLGCCALWGLNMVAIKVASAGVPPMLSAGVRSAVAGALLGAWCGLRRIPLRGIPPGYALLLGAAFAAEFSLIYLGLVYTSASRSVIFLFTSPFFVALGAHWFLPGDRLSAARLAGLGLAFGGVCLAVADGLGARDRLALWGDGLELTAAFVWGATTVFVKRASGGRVSPHQTLFAQLAVSAPLLLAIAFAAGDGARVTLSRAVVTALAYQAAVVAFATYLVWYWLLAFYPASPLAAFSFWTPLFGVAAGALILGEPVGGRILAAAVLVALGIVFVNRPARAGRRETGAALATRPAPVSRARG